MTGDPAPLGRRWRLLVSAADQGVSSLTNIGVLILAARALGVEDFGRFSFVYILYILTVGLLQAYVGHVLVLQDPSAARARIRSALSVVGCAGLVVAALIAVSAWAVGGSLSASLVALAVVLPVILLQDCTRYLFSALLLPQWALAVDLIWLVVSAPLMLSFQQVDAPARSILLWASGSLAALALGATVLLRRSRGTPRVPLGVTARSYLGHRFALEYGTLQTGSQVSVLGLGVIGSVVATGALRSVSTLMGPMNVLFVASQTFGTPMVAEQPSEAARLRAARVISGALALASLAWAGGLLLIPDAWGRAILGASWASASPLIPYFGIQYVVIGVITGSRVFLRITAPRSTLRLQLANSVAIVLGIVGGYLVAGVEGAAVGIVLAAAVELMLTVVIERSITRAARHPGLAGGAPSLTPARRPL